MRLENKNNNALIWQGYGKNGHFVYFLRYILSLQGYIHNDEEINRGHYLLVK